MISKMGAAVFALLCCEGECKTRRGRGQQAFKVTPPPSFQDRLGRPVGASELLKE